MPTWTKPVTIVVNTNENANDLNAILDDIYSRANGGLDETNVPNLTAAFTSYKPGIANGRALISSAAVAGTYAVVLGSSVLNGTFPAGANPPAIEAIAVELDPVRFNANARTTKLNLRLRVMPNAVAPAITFTAGLYQILTTSGISGSGPVAATASAVISGSTAAVASPGALSVASSTSSGDFNCPAAGIYALAVVTSGTPAAGSVNAVDVVLDMRQV